VISAIELAANEFLLGALEKLGHKMGPPIPVEEIATGVLGLKLVEKPLLEDLSGELVFVDKVLVVNRRHTASRRRFTVAHEIGHWVLHVQITGDLVSCGKASNERMEIEANAFAASILMPKRLVYVSLLDALNAGRTDDALGWARIALRRNDDGYLHVFNSLLYRLLLGGEAASAAKRAELVADVVPSLALLFRVSREAMTLRLKKLGLLEGILD